MFPIHGTWKIIATDTYVLQWFGGCWNEEAAIQYTQEFLEKTAHLNGKKWAIMSFFEDWELGVPEIEPHIVKHCQSFKDRGCIKDCHVYTPTAVKEMQLENMIPHTEGKYERQVFVDVEHAIKWLGECGFNINKADL